MTEINVENVESDKYYLTYHQGNPSFKYTGFLIFRRKDIRTDFISIPTIYWLNEMSGAERPVSFFNLEHDWLYFELSEDEFLKHYIVEII